jgi:hypothetical protein
LSQRGERRQGYSRAGTQGAADEHRTSTTRLSSAVVAAIFASDQTCESLFQIPASGWLGFLQVNHVPHSKVGRRWLAKVSDVVSAFDRLVGRESQSPTDDEIVELASRRRGSRGAR